MTELPRVKKDIVCFGCGHERAMDLRGTLSERVAFRRKAAAEDCYACQRERAIAFVRREGLPPIAAVSDKQRRYAEGKRALAWPRIAMEFESLRAAHEGDYTRRAIIDKVKTEVKNTWYPHFWIEGDAAAKARTKLTKHLAKYDEQEAAWARQEPAAS